MYITAQGLRNLDNYGYHGVDHSFFGNLILKHWWNWFVERVPLWFAPNLLTLLGLVCNVLAYVITAIYTPHLTEPVPRWVCFISAILIFLYQTLDNVDGKQARRTGSSSPLGELFDHGCDSITMGLIGIITGATLRLGGLLTVLGLVVGWGPFYLAHWEEYHTGILIMGKFNGPTEAQLIVIGLLILTGIVGPWMWVHTLFYIGDTAIGINHIAFVFTIVFSLITIGQNFFKVLALPTRAMSTKDTLLQLLPLTCLVVFSLLWLTTENSLLKSHPHVSLMAISLLFAYLVSRIIVNRVCKEPTQLFHGILIPLIIVAVVGVIGAIRDTHGGDLGLAVTLLVLSGLQFVFFSVSIVHQLTSHLGIHAFTIVPIDPAILAQQPPPPPSQQQPLLNGNDGGNGGGGSGNLEIQIDDGDTHSIE